MSAVPSLGRGSALQAAQSQDAALPGAANRSHRPQGKVGGLSAARPVRAWSALEPAPVRDATMVRSVQADASRLETQDLGARGGITRKATTAA